MGCQYKCFNSLQCSSASGTSILAWFCYGTANTPFCKNRNVKSHGPCSLHTVGQQRQKRVKMSLNLVVFSEIIIKAQHIYSVTPAQTIHSAAMQPLNPSYGLACSGKDAMWENETQKVRKCCHWSACAYWIKSITNYLNKASVEVPGSLL